MILAFAVILVLIRVLYSIGEMYFERDWPVATVRGLLVSIGLLIVCACAFGQTAARVDLPLQTYGPNVPTSQGPMPQTLWVANSTVRVCTHPSATYAACVASPMTTYTDSTEATPCTAATPLVQLPGNTCTASTGIAANVGFWYAGGIADFWISTSYGQFGPFTVNPPYPTANPSCVGTGPTQVCTFPGNLGVNGAFNAQSTNIQLNAAQYSSIQAALTAATALGNDVRIPPGTYNLTNELYVPKGVNVFAYGATLTWTALGSTTCTPNNAAGTTPGANCYATGNGVRMTSNTGWYGGTIVFNNVPFPCTSISSGSVPFSVCSGAYWNQFVIGHFDPSSLEPSTTMASGVSNVTIQDVQLQLLAGNRNVGIETEGLVSNIYIKNIVDNHFSTTTQLPASWGSGGDTSFDSTWGADNTYIYRPHKITIDHYILNGYVSSTSSPTSADVEVGFDLSGVYDVSLNEITVTTSKYPFELYFGDPGDCSSSCTGPPSSTLPSYNGTGQVMSGINLTNSTAYAFNIGVEILGDPSGAIYSAHGSNPVRAKIENLNLFGLGTASSYGNWTANLGVLQNQSDNWQLITGTIQNVYDGVYFNGIQSGATYFPFQGINISGNEIHNVGRAGMRISTTYKASVENNNIWNVGLDTGAITIQRGCVYDSGLGNRFINNTCGNVNDAATAEQYGFYTNLDGSGKLTPSNGANNILIGNQVNAANVAAYDGNATVYVADTFTNTVYGSINFSADPSYPALQGASLQLGSTKVSAFAGTGAGIVTGPTSVTANDAPAYAGSADGRIVDSGYTTSSTHGQYSAPGGFIPTLNGLAAGTNISLIYVDQAITVTRVNFSNVTSASGCSTNARLELYSAGDLAATAFDITGGSGGTGLISQALSGGTSYYVRVKTAAAGCGTYAQNISLTVQYTMQ